MSWFLFHNLTFATWQCMACTWSYLRSKLQALALQLRIHTDVNSKAWRTDLPLYKSNGLKHITAWVYLRAFNLLGIRNACFQNTSSVLYSGFHKERKKKISFFNTMDSFWNGCPCVQPSVVSTQQEHTSHCRTQLWVWKNAMEAKARPWLTDTIRSCL